MRKTKILLDAIVQSGKSVMYFAVDLSEKSLRDSLAPLAQAFPSIHFVGLLGTYDDSLLWAQSNIRTDLPKLFFWLGSSIGNMIRSEAATFLKSVQEIAMNHRDLFICGIDRRNDPAKVRLAYDDSEGLTRLFIMNGLDHANAILGKSVFDLRRFEYVSIVNEREGRHEAYYKSLEDQELDVQGSKMYLEKDEWINVEYSYKYSAEEVKTLVNAIGLHLMGKWTDSQNLYDLHLFQKI